MIKLKKILKESKYAWDREFGDPLPTFKDVAETHQKEKPTTEDLDPYKDFGTDNSWEKEYDLNLGAFIDEYQKFIKAAKKLKPINDKNKRAWAHAIRKKVGQSMFNGYIGLFTQPIKVLERFKKFEKLKNKDFHFTEGKQIDENYKYNSSTPVHRLLIGISNAMSDLYAKGILAKVAKMNPDAKGKVKEAEKAVRRAGKLVDELSDMV